MHTLKKNYCCPACAVEVFGTALALMDMSSGVDAQSPEDFTGIPDFEW